MRRKSRTTASKAHGKEWNIAVLEDIRGHRAEDPASILSMTSEAGSGHATSALSATEPMAGLFFGSTFRYDLVDPDHSNNDRLIVSKGHATPLFYSLWAAAGRVSQDVFSYRRFRGPLEGLRASLSGSRQKPRNWIERRTRSSAITYAASR